MKRRFVKTSKEWRQRLLYAASAIASAFADYCINYIAIVLGLPMFFSVLSSKTGSSLLNYALNRNYVFRQGNKAAPNVSIFRYYCLWVTQTIIGSALATLVVSLAAASNPTQKILLRMPIDIIIFGVNYVVQKNGYSERLSMEYIISKPDA